MIWSFLYHDKKHLCYAYSATAEDLALEDTQNVLCIV